MKVKELITRLLDMPMDIDISLQIKEKHLDEWGNECSTYLFDIDSIEQGYINFTDWRKEKWIPCSRKMPEETTPPEKNTPVLISTDDGSRICAIRYKHPKTGEILWNNNGYLYHDSTVLAWMPLPEAYKKNKGENPNENKTL